MAIAMNCILIPLLLVCIGCQQGYCQTVTPVDEIPECRPHVLSQCATLNYTTTFPNLRGQSNPTDIENEFLQFEILFRYNCSNALLILLCSVYAPFCGATSANSTPVVLEPCRNLCQHVFEGCIAVFREFQYPWPTQLECERFPDRSNSELCFGPTGDPADIPYPNLVSANSTIALPVTTDSPMTMSPTSPAALECPNIRLSTRLSGLPDYNEYELGGNSACGIPCGGLYFSETERNKVAPAFVLVLSLFCVMSTVFSVTTFLIDRLRFHYPERPIVFLCTCYLAISIVFIVGTVSKLSSDDGSTSFACSGDNRSFVFQKLPFKAGEKVSFKAGSCVTTFVFLYFFQMAAAVWWDILTFTWFLAATFKWGEEAIERFWMFYHGIGWGLPTLQVIFVMSLRLVDGDQLTGVCSVGNFDRTALGVFVFMPMTIYLLTGMVFLVIGFSALLNIRIQVKRDVQKAQKLGKLIMRIGVFSFLYIVPNFVVILLYIYELVGQETWEEEQVINRACLNTDSDDCSRPQFAAFFLKYLMMLVVGITSCFWVFSVKTIIAWRKFIDDICCCFNLIMSRGSSFDINSAQPAKESRV
ncbi:frizzled-2-like [Dysidea avara]|uniref:frizzled-2-like n=1 Tax=Dysidea avara TaxID=196820 RepID=UPI00332B9E74